MSTTNQIPLDDLRLQREAVAPASTRVETVEAVERVPDRDRVVAELARVL